MAKNTPKSDSFEAMVDSLREDFRNKLVPPLGGFVYRFTIYLPLLSEGKPVFTDHHRQALTRLFLSCMQGFSESASENTPPWHGSWAPPGSHRPVIDRHTLIVAYTPQIEDAKDFFRRLRWILECKHVANQDVVLIEHTTAWIVDKVAPSNLV